MHIDQANLVFEAKQVDSARYNFVNGDIYNFDYSSYGPFDVIFCFGIFYHINKPICLMELMSFCSLVVIDTSVLNMEGSYIELIKESTTDPRNSINHELIFMSSKQAIIDMASQFGYKTDVLLPELSNYLGSEDYRTGRRLAFICQK